ncbi:MAG: hypothetical protein RIQ90_1766 [Bacteroidota bacterium]|jgi:hypothetical protein
MILLDKAYVSVTPKKAFWDYISLHRDDLDEVIPFHLPSVYLIDEDCWDEEQFVKKYAQKIAFTESSLLLELDKTYLILENWEHFHTYFTFSLGDVVFDTQ